MSQTNRGKDKQKIVLRVRIKKPDFHSAARALFAGLKTAYFRFINSGLEWRFLAMVAVIVLAEIYGILQPFFQDRSYALGKSETLLPESSPIMAERVKFDYQQQAFNFNADQTKSAGTLGRDLTASSVLHKDASKGIKVNDPKNNIDFSMTPLYHLAPGKQQGDRIVYPLMDGTGWAVYTMQGVGVKEDIVLTHAPGEMMAYKYKLDLGNSLSAKIEGDGGLGIYGNTLFSSNITAGTDKDAA